MKPIDILFIFTGAAMSIILFDCIGWRRVAKWTAGIIIGLLCFFAFALVLAGHLPS